MKQQGKKLNALTSLRFFAAAMIVLLHSKGQIFFTESSLAHWALNGGVPFFFVLSGFILSYVYPSIKGKDELKRFYAARIARIWPAHLFFLVIFIYLAIDPNFRPGSLILNILLLQAWIPDREVFFGYNSVSWTLSVEMFFYLLFPFLISGFRENWKVKLAAAVGIVAVLIILCDAFGLQKDTGAAALTKFSSTAFIGINPLVHLLEFIFGMVIYQAWMAVKGKVVLTKLQWTAIEILAFGLVVFSLYLTPEIEKIGTGALFEYLGYTAPTVPFGVLIFVMAFESGLVSRALGIKPLVFLGEISYSIYLSHQIFIRWILAHVRDLSFTTEANVYLLFWVFMIGFCALAWVLIERPARRGILGLATQFSPKPIEG